MVLGHTSVTLHLHISHVFEQHRNYQVEQVSTTREAQSDNKYMNWIIQDTVLVLTDQHSRNTKPHEFWTIH